MQVVILAGGEGTRMLPATATVAKAMLPIAGFPFVDWQLARVRRHPIDNILLCVGRFGGQIISHLGSGNSTYVRDIGLKYSWEPYKLGTLGALVYAHKKGLLEENFTLTYGDTWHQFDMLGPMRELARSNEKTAGVMAIHMTKTIQGSGNVNLYQGDAASVADYGPGVGGFEDSGCIALRRKVLDNYTLPYRDEPLDLRVLWASLINQNALKAHPLLAPPYEMGSPNGFAELEERLTG